MVDSLVVIFKSNAIAIGMEGASDVVSDLFTTDSAPTMASPATDRNDSPKLSRSALNALRPLVQPQNTPTLPSLDEVMAFVRSEQEDASSPNLFSSLALSPTTRFKSTIAASCGTFAESSAFLLCELCGEGQAGLDELIRVGRSSSASLADFVGFVVDLCLVSQRGAERKVLELLGRVGESERRVDSLCGEGVVEGVWGLLEAGSVGKEEEASVWLVGLCERWREGGERKEGKEREEFVGMLRRAGMEEWLEGMRESEWRERAEAVLGWVRSVEGKEEPQSEERGAEGAEGEQSENGEKGEHSGGDGLILEQPDTTAKDGTEL
ncbi:hypothetical protein BLNAU_16364 [Blattamonas nauphoetae]|uniref:Uncharacterized protein n=1 Tax=Blattamonas nauphoetae TaxID=2049346 RepID=A0ABQ9X8D3_9EUKA|nr:hypothetical protein BLNAU_16364 [Blattamonas nauphoetae]